MTSIQLVILYAPNVHTGGGLMLLRSLLLNGPEAMPLTAFLDERARNQLVLPPKAQVTWVAPRLGSRLAAEWGLHRAAATEGRVLCFHGLPPLLPCAAKVTVFLQNRLYVQPDLNGGYKWKTRLRLTAERLLSRAFKHRVALYLVQTPTMRQSVLTWLGEDLSGRVPQVQVLPFVATLPAKIHNVCTSPAWDFVYVADGEAHKNHAALLAAWELLAQEGIRPKLALTLGERDTALAKHIASTSKRLDLQIFNCGHLPHDEVVAMYASARALVFPSDTESFGLPLIEAAHMGLPIVASELDYVRDVCTPVQTFNPRSPVSIARAVKRFLALPESPLPLSSASDFWTEWLKDGQA